jgi:hypothetical protein
VQADKHGWIEVHVQLSAPFKNEIDWNITMHKEDFFHPVRNLALQFVMSSGMTVSDKARLIAKLKPGDVTDSDIESSDQVRTATPEEIRQDAEWRKERLASAAHQSDNPASQDTSLDQVDESLIAAGKLIGVSYEPPKKRFKASSMPRLTDGQFEKLKQEAALTVEFKHM